MRQQDAASEVLNLILIGVHMASIRTTATASIWPMQSQGEGLRSDGRGSQNPRTDGARERSVRANGAQFERCFAELWAMTLARPCAGTSTTARVRACLHRPRDDGESGGVASGEKPARTRAARCTG
eukprot:6205562-Pleurochrysis_carterae.AAC.3